MGMPIVRIPPFRLLIKGYQNFLIDPRMDGKAAFRKLLKLLALFVFLVYGVFVKVLHENADNLLGPLLHPLHVKVHLSSNLVLGHLVLIGGVRVGIVDGATVAAGDDHPLARLLLDVVKELREDRIDALLAVDDGEAVPIAPFAVSEGGGLGGVCRIYDGRVEGGASTTEKSFSDSGKVRLRFPRIGGARGVDWGGNGVENVVVIPINRLPLTVETADLLPLRLLHP
jgi:hypothetical protein